MIKKLVFFQCLQKNRRTEINKDYIKLLSKNNYKFFDYSKYALKNIFLEGTGSMVLDRENKKHIAVFLKDQTNHFF